MMHQRRVCLRGDRCQPLTDKARLNCAILHHPELTSEQIARGACVKHARLLKYASETQVDQIPADALHRLCAFIDRWDLLDASLQRYQRRVVALELEATGSSALDEAIDMQSSAAAVLQSIRNFARGGFTLEEKVVIHDLLRNIRKEVDDVEVALDGAHRLTALKGGQA